jgi:hypothetical protein
VVDAVVDGLLVGRIIIGHTAMGQVWQLDGRACKYATSPFDISGELCFELNKLYDNEDGVY